MAELETAAAAQTGEVAESSDFASLLNKEFKPKSDRAKTEVESAVQTLAEFVLKDVSVVSQDAVESIQAVIAQIDKKLSEQVNLILHHEEFQALESAWRGLHYMVNNTETDEMLKIRVFNISKKN
jgi:type VI secretion system protein ImpC